jgi:hypothetical protein
MRACRPIPRAARSPLKLSASPFLEKPVVYGRFQTETSLEFQQCVVIFLLGWALSE